MKIAVICVASLAVLQFGLAMNCSLNRRRGKVSHGMKDDPDDPLYRAVVAHRNCCEYAPMLAILMLLLQAYGTASAWMLYLPPVVVIARVVHAFGILHFTLRKPNWLRVLGTAATYTLGMLYVGLLFYSAAT